MDGAAAAAARKFYCGTIGAEFVHIDDTARRRWIAERLESDAPQPDRAYILERLIRAELFEQVLQARYLGSKRFSLEGVTAIIPLLDRVLEAAHAGGEQVMLGMSHRGRLNVMAHIAGQREADIFAGFEDVDPRSVLGSGDVKYHVGATGDYRTRDGRRLSVHLASNPSHLEAVDPVAIGRARAKADARWRRRPLRKFFRLCCMAMERLRGRAFGPKRSTSPGPRPIRLAARFM